MSEGTLPAAFANIRAAITELGGTNASVEGSHVDFDQQAGAAHGEAIQQGQNTITELDVAVENIGQSTKSIESAENKNNSAATKLEDAIKFIGTVAGLLGESSKDIGAAAGTTNKAQEDGTAKAGKSHTDLREKVTVAQGASEAATGLANNAAGHIRQAWDPNTAGAHRHLQTMMDEAMPLPERTSDYREVLGEIEASASLEDSQRIVGVHKALGEGETNLTKNGMELDKIKEILEGAGSSLQDQLDKLRTTTSSIGETRESLTDGQGQLDSVKGNTQEAVNILTEIDQVPAKLANSAAKAAAAGNDYLAPHGA